MNPGITLSLIDAIPVGAFVLGFIVEKAFVHKGFKDETRKTLQRIKEGYREAA
jgi:hypothetical protein